MRIYVILGALLIAACGPSTDELPEDLESLEELKKETSLEIAELQKRLDSIEAKIAVVDTTREVMRRLVTVREVKRSDFNRYAKIQGAVQSKDLVGVSSEIGGNIVTLTVDEGDAVQRGRLIATIDMESLEKQRDELEKSLELAREIYTRQKNLWDQNIGSEVQYLEAKNHVERLEKSIETVNTQLKKGNLYAPITGVVDVVNLKPGETASPGMPIVMILDTRNLKVVADVSENYLGKVSQGEKVKIRFPALNDTLIASVTMIGRKIDPTNRTFKIEVDLPRQPGEYKPNLLAEVLINDYTEEDVVIISQEMVQEEVGGKDFVMIVDTVDGLAHGRKIYVKTGRNYEGDVVITEGLSGGEALIIDGARGLTDDQPIRIASVNPTQVSSDGTKD